MATPVTQYTSPDPSLISFPNFQSFVQYLITGTNYIVDYKAQIVYLFSPANPGVLNQTGPGNDFTTFQAYLLANPVTSTLPNPNGPAGGPATFGFPYNFQQIPAAGTPVYDQSVLNALDALLLELRCMRLAMVKLATDGGGHEEDFNPTRDPGFAGTDGASFT